MLIRILNKCFTKLIENQNIKVINLEFRPEFEHKLGPYFFPVYLKETIAIPYTRSLFSKISTDNRNLICLIAIFLPYSLLCFCCLLCFLFLSALSLALSFSISVLEEAGEGSESPRQRIRLRSPRTPIARRRRREKTDGQRLLIIEIDHYYCYYIHLWFKVFILYNNYWVNRRREGRREGG